MKPSARERIDAVYAAWAAPGSSPDIEALHEEAMEHAFRDGFAAALAMLYDAPDAVLDAMRAAAAYRLDLPVGVEGEREKYRRRLRAALAVAEASTKKPA